LPQCRVDVQESEQSKRWEKGPRQNEEAVRRTWDARRVSGKYNRHCMVGGEVSRRTRKEKRGTGRRGLNKKRKNMQAKNVPPFASSERRVCVSGGKKMKKGSPGGDGRKQA